MMKALNSDPAHSSGKALLSSPTQSPMGGFRWTRADSLALAALAVVILLAFYPMALEGKIPLDRDTLTFYYPLASAFQEPDIWLWNPWQLGGCSFIADPQSALFYPPNWIFLILPTGWGYIISMLGHYYLAAVGMYLLARFCRLSVSSALVSVLVFCLGGYLVSRLLLRPLLMSAAWFPYVFLCFLYGHYRNILLGYLLAGIFLALQILSGMPHNAVYSAMAFGFFTLYKLIIELPYTGNFRIWIAYLSRYLLFIGVGVVLSAVTLIPTLDILPHTVRTLFTYEEAVNGSVPWRWLPDIFVGGSFHQALVDWHFLETNCYAGVIGVWLILFGLMGHWQRGIYWFFAGLVFISLLFALGRNTPVYHLFYHFPYLSSLGVPSLGNFFDLPARFLGLTAFALAMLAGYGMQVLSESSVRGSGRLNRRSLAILIMLSTGCLIWAVILMDLFIRFGKGLFPVIMNPAIKGEMGRYYAHLNFSFFTLVFGLFTLAFLLGWMRRRMFQALLLFALAADLLHSGTQVEVEYGLPKDIYQPPLVIRYLQERADPSLRVLGFDALKTIGGDVKHHYYRQILTPKLALLYRLQDVSGYDPLILRRYSELVQQTVGQAPGESPSRVVAWASPHHALLDLLRVGYVSGEVHERLVFSGQMDLRSGERRILRVSPQRDCVEIRIRSVIQGGVTLRQDEQVGRAILRNASGEQLIIPLRAGIETADLFVESAHFHHPAKPYHTWSAVVQGKKIRIHNYVAQIRFPYLFHPVELEFENESPARLSILSVGLTETSLERFELVFDSRGERVYRNHTALPKAWWVHQVYVEPSPRRLLEWMDYGTLPDGRTLDYRSLALVEQNPPFQMLDSGEAPSGRVEILEWYPDRIVMEVENDAPGLLVLSEMNYPGWQARIEGKSADIVPVNYILRGLYVEAGHHRIEMVYQPRAFYYGFLASLLAVVLVFLLFFRFRRRFPVLRY